VPFLLLALRLARSSGADRHTAHRLFVFSLFYLFVLFAAVVVDHGGGSLMRSPRGGYTAGSLNAELQPGAISSAHSLIKLSTSEV
jgi:protoheme IX farnesyltransferase